MVYNIACYNGEIFGVLNTVFNTKSISQLWERVGKLPVEIFHLKFCKGLLGVQPKTHNGAVIGELGKFQMFKNVIKSTLKYIIHLNEI